ncbi:ROK family protein [Plantibacter sp. ME-Dv--P-095]|uniref:ROK family protein n=1 Tax=Plantibacter sp. ME-Dv--P-095 TaxID=3040299 RepID=UPI00254ECCD2|nr:ROK family protein [Plantibacter sp. ME-Dv--P-095]
MTAGAVLGVDVGGTGVKAALTAADGTVLGRWREATPVDDPSGSRTRDVVLRLVETAHAVSPPVAVGVVVPGVVDEEQGVCIHAVNLGWRDLAFPELLRPSLDVPLAFGQDVRAGALAEAVSLATAGIHGTIAFVPVGTGLASALVIGGVPFAGGGWAGEIGQRVIQDGPHRGLRVEELASAGGIARRAGTRDAKTVADAAARGKAPAVAIWNDAIDALAEALAGITVVAAPAAIVVGGGLALAGPALFEPLERALRDRLAIVRVPAILPARHGDEAATVGAGILARRLVTAR